jgi:cytochrome c-type biogenesis protein CcmH
MLSIPTCPKMDLNPEPIAKLKAQLAQLDALIAEGVLTGDDAKTARAALEAQVLAAVLRPVAGAAGGAATAEKAEAAAPVPRAPRKLVAGVAVFVLAFAAGGYAWLGNRDGWAVSPGEPGAAPAQAQGQEHSTESAQIEAMITRLAERLKTKPDDAEGWSMLGRSYNSQGRYAEALTAYKRAYELRPKDAQVLADYADGLAVANNRSLDGEPEKLILEAVKIDPQNVKALALAGTVSFNHADYKGAVDYWERAVKASDPAGDFAKQLQGALNEARQRGGMPPVAAAPGAAPADLFAPNAAQPAAEAAPAPAVAAGKEAITGRLTLKAELKGQVGPDDTVFIFARAPTGSKMPLAILRKKVSDLPLDFKLDDSLAMSPASRLSSASQVVVGARISKTGNAMPSPGDLQVLSAPMALGAQGVRIEIAEAVR